MSKIRSKHMYERIGDIVNFWRLRTFSANWVLSTKTIYYNYAYLNIMDYV